MRKRPREEVPVAVASSIKYWLMKSEPDVFSIADLKAKKISPWDGVRNYSARNNMNAMAVGDKVLFYHSNAKPSGVAGLAEVCRVSYPDDTATDSSSKYFDAKTLKSNKNPWTMVDVRYIGTFDRVISLQELREDRSLSGMVLLTHGRLSVQPVTASQYSHIVKKAVLA